MATPRMVILWFAAQCLRMRWTRRRIWPRSSLPEGVLVRARSQLTATGRRSTCFTRRGFGRKSALPS